MLNICHCFCRWDLEIYYYIFKWNVGWDNNPGICKDLGDVTCNSHAGKSSNIVH